MPRETLFSNSLADIQEFLRTLKSSWTTIDAQREIGPIKEQPTGDKNVIKSTIQGLLVAAIALGGSASAIADDEDAGHLHGIWRMTRTPINCQSGQQVAPSFQAIMTFHEDGTLTGY